MMTSHETRSTHSARKAASEQNDLKKLKAKYSSKLPTLQFLFNDWTDDDLLFALEEANGDVDLTIDRISEGRANQWGEVKTKKSKKEAQKQKAATVVPSSHQTSSYSSTPSSYHRETKSTQPRYNDRVSRPKAPVNATNRTRSTKNSSSSWENNNTSSSTWDNTPSWDTKATSNQEPAGGGSWASIAKQPQDGVVDEGWNSTTYTTNTSSSQTAAAAAATDDWAPVPDNNTTSTNDQPKTWASLLKTKPKPEPSEPTEQTTSTTTNTDWDSPATQDVTSDWDTPANTTTSEWNAPAAAVNDFNEPAAPSLSGWDASEPAIDEWATPVNVNNSFMNTKEQEEEKEEEDVVSPVKESVNVTSSVTELDVKFGSLQVDEEPTIVQSIETTTITSIPEPVVQTSSSPKEKEAPAIPETTPSPTPVAAATTNDVLDQPITNHNYLKEEPVAPVAAYQQQQPEEPQQQAPVQPQVQPQVQQQQQPQQQQVPQQQATPVQPQQQQQQQQFGMDHLTSAYSSYLPNQPPAGISGFGMNPMGANLPDYGIYGTDAAQRAAAMGYYDPTAFSHSPSVTSASAYQNRDKYGQDTTHGQTGAGQNQNMPQQMYPTNLPYYQYYYMPNQFNAYQQSAAAYGQPFMNKSVYPNIYSKPGSSPYGGGAAANATGSPYGNASPYANHQSQLYGQSTAAAGSNSTYDDLMDYQKSMYSQQQPQQQQPLQGFLGSLNNQPQQQAASSQPQQQPQQPQQQQKSDRGSNTPQQQPQQPQPQQPMPYTNTQNYFGQPQQMFGYGQYPQQQQQYQQMPQGQRQQQYWNQ
ncbi:hypothetical protein K501DRAFT_337448 [Backusella circina FSU 941]|nr:hypothetical protein K501DRAFT_337448 [Backusella circina FSU 941]